jgi:hypothetical protein
MRELDLWFKERVGMSLYDFAYSPPVVHALDILGEAIHESPEYTITIEIQNMIEELGDDILAEEGFEFPF